MQLTVNPTRGSTRPFPGRAGWILTAPASLLALISTALSIVHARNLLGPYESRLSYSTSVGTFLASAMLLASVAINLCLLRRSDLRLEQTVLSGIAGLLAIPQACYYLWSSRIDAHHLLDSTIWLLAAMTVIGQLVFGLSARRSRTGRKGL